MKATAQKETIFSPFQQFKESLISKSGAIVIVCPNSNFIYWAKQMVGEILGKPLEAVNNRWRYNNKVIHFISVSRPSDEYRLRGYGQDQIVNCNGYITDDYLGVKRNIWE